MPLQNIKIPKWVNEHLPPDLANSKAFKFTITLSNSQKIEIDLFHDIDVDYDMLEHQMERTPAQLVYWGAILSEVKCQVAMFDRRADSRKGFLVDSIQQIAKKDNLKMTDKQMVLLIEKDEDLIRLEEAVVKLEAQERKLYYMVEAVKMKADMLRSLAGFKRQEREQTS